MNLLEGGFADGAMARWRTLHELSVIATVISDGGEAVAERYVYHQAIEAKGALDEYLRCYELLGFRPMPVREIASVNRHYDLAIKKFGPEFKSPYGWASDYIGKKKPILHDLETAAGRAAMHSYKFASLNVHASSRGTFYTLGLLDGQTGQLAGASNVGLSEPGQNTAITLTQVTGLLVRPKARIEEILGLRVLLLLRDRIPAAFVKVEKQIARAEAQRCQVNRSSSKGKSVGQQKER